MNTDYFFTQGRSHSLCQDYAIAGKKKGVRYAILSDGCSGKSVPEQPGSPWTDIGARLMVRAASHWVKSLVSTHPGLTADHIGYQIVRQASHISYVMDLPDTCLDATLLVAMCDGESENPIARVVQYGDGLVAARRRTGEIACWSIEYSKGMPYYLSYQLDKRSKANFVRQEQEVTTAYNGDQMTVLTGMAAMKICHPYEFDPKEFDLVLVMSDGIESFSDRQGRRVPVMDVLREIFAFKSYAGDFVQRRCRRIVDKCAALGWLYADDWSVAGIYLDEPK